MSDTSVLTNDQRDRTWDYLVGVPRDPQTRNKISQTLKKKTERNKRILSLSQEFFNGQISAETYLSEYKIITQ